MHPALCWRTLLKLYITWTLLALKLTVHVWTYPHCALLCVDELDSGTLLKFSTVYTVIWTLLALWRTPPVVPTTLNCVWACHVSSLNCALPRQSLVWSPIVPTCAHSHGCSIGRQSLVHVIFNYAMPCVCSTRDCDRVSARSLQSGLEVVHEMTVQTPPESSLGTCVNLSIAQAAS